MTNIDIVNIVIALGGIIVGVVVALFATAWANRVNKRIAQEAGSFRKPKILVSFFGKNLSWKENNELWVLLHPGNKDDRVVYPFQFTIENTGDAPLKDAVLTIQALKPCIQMEEGTGVKLTTNIVPGVLKDSFKHSVVDLGKRFRQISFLLPSINPFTSMCIVYPFIFTPTISVSGSTDAVCKDGVKVKVFFKADFSLFFTVNLLSSEGSQHFSFNVASMMAKDLKDAFQKFVAPLLEKVRKDFSSLPFWHKLTYMFLKQKSLQIVRLVEYDIEKKIETEGRTAYIR